MKGLSEWMRLAGTEWPVFLSSNDPNMSSRMLETSWKIADTDFEKGSFVSRLGLFLGGDKFQAYEKCWGNYFFFLSKYFRWWSFCVHTRLRTCLWILLLTLAPDFTYTCILACTLQKHVVATGTLLFLDTWEIPSQASFYVWYTLNVFNFIT